MSTFIDKYKAQIIAVSFVIALIYFGIASYSGQPQTTLRTCGMLSLGWILGAAWEKEKAKRAARGL